MEARKAVTESNNLESRVLDLVRSLLVELGSQRALRNVALQASLERDLGLGSLERVELLLRLEREFSVRLSESVMTEAETPADLVNALRNHQTVSAENLRAAPGVFSSKSLQVAFDPASAATLDEVLRRYAELDPHRPQVHLRLDNGEFRTLSYATLFEGASVVAAGLLERGMRRGETIALMLPTSEDFFLAFFGVLLAGCVPVPIYPPFRPDRLEEYAQRQALILQNAEARLLITFRQAEKLMRLLRPRIPSLMGVLTVEALGKAQSRVIPVTARPGEPALIQYTSGSTGDPKGVVLTHANLIANIRATGQAITIHPSDVGVSWLPLYHDMGLIGSWLFCLYFGVPIAILSPVAFLSRPERWLWTIHNYRATLSVAPNFAYELCIRKIDAQALEGLDLSCWRASLNGAEPISPDTLARFSRRFGPYGYRPEAMLPVYGLAESAVALTCPPLGRIPRIDCVAREKFQQQGKAEPTSELDRTALRFVSVGQALAEHEVRVVDDQDRVVPERTEGNIQFRGPSTMAGYFHNPEATHATLHDGWTDTGDLGYQVDSELFVTGRQKDIIIKAGRNIYPQEIEEIASEVEGVRRGCVAAFGVKDDRMGTERLAVVAETRETDPVCQESLISEITSRVDSILGIPPDIVHLVPPQSVPKTSSGKIRRDACRNMYLSGTLGSERLPPWMQVLKLSLLSGKDWLKLATRQAGELIYGCYAWLMLAAIGLPSWLAMLVCPSFPSKKPAAIFRFLCRASLRLAGLFPRIEGQEHLRPDPNHPRDQKPSVLVSNHASYIDPLVLMAALPLDFLFVVKREAASWPLVGTFIRKCGYHTVDRDNPARSRTDSEHMAQQLRQGFPVHLFAEGTFTQATGLRPFQMGAFKLAVETGCPILPVTLSGNRNVLRDKSWLPRRRSIQVVISPLVFPESSGWKEMVRLRDVVRQEILKHCGETSLDIVGAGAPKE